MPHRCDDAHGRHDVTKMRMYMIKSLAGEIRGYKCHGANCDIRKASQCAATPAVHARSARWLTYVSMSCDMAQLMSLPSLGRRKCS
eukprot:scaffold285725_cov29-Tisochrysis_lutea.AAC.2